MVRGLHVDLEPLVVRLDEQGHVAAAAGHGVQRRRAGGALDDRRAQARRDGADGIVRGARSFNADARRAPAVRRREQLREI